MIDIAALQKLVSFGDEDKQLILQYRSDLHNHLDTVAKQYHQWFLQKAGWNKKEALPVLPGYLESIVGGDYEEAFISLQYRQALYWYQNELDATTSIAAISKLSSILHDTSTKIEMTNLPQAVCKVVAISQAILSVVHHISSTHKLLHSSASSEISRIHELSRSFSDEVPQELAHAYIEHLNWKLRAYSLALGYKLDTHELQLSPNECVLGRWLNAGGINAIDKEVRSGFISAHDRLHEIARQLLSLAEAGEPENMVIYLLDMESASKEVTLILGEHIERELRKLVTIDSLTQIGNRRRFLGDIERRIGEASRTKMGFGLLFLDVDHFKEVNDSYGHGVGDEVLQGVARSIMRALRNTDIPYRWGGEEFVILAPAVEQPSIQNIAQRVLSEVRENPITTSSGPIEVTVSIGCAYYDPESDWSIDELVSQADLAMLEAKKQGRNRSSCHCNAP